MLVTAAHCHAYTMRPVTRMQQRISISMCREIKSKHLLHGHVLVYPSTVYDWISNRTESDT